MSNYGEFIHVVSLTILCYDHLLTLPAEVRLFWSQNNRALAPLLFYISRYTAILGHIPIAYTSFTLLDTDLCFKLQCYHQIYTSMSFALTTTLLVMRTCVLYHESRPIRSLLIMFNFATVCQLTGLTVKNLTIMSPPPYKAAETCSKIVIDKVPGYYYAAMWISAALFDCIIFILIIRKTWRNRSRGLIEHSLFDLFLRDGSIYFGVLILLYLANIFTFLLCSPYYKGLLVVFTEAMAHVLTGRIMLNIREMGRASLSISSDTDGIEFPEMEFQQGSYSNEAS